LQIKLKQTVTNPETNHQWFCIWVDELLGYWVFIMS